MGSNLQGQLGLGSRKQTHSSVPCLVESLIDEQVVNVSCGSSHTAAATSNGYAYSWGMGEFGALGLGETTMQCSPTQIKYFSMNRIFVESTSCGAKHTIFVASIYLY